MQNNRPLRIGVLMDPIEHITPYKDSTFAMMLAAQARRHTLHYFQQSDLVVRDGLTHVRSQPITVKDNDEDYYQLGEQGEQPLHDFDIVLMRKDPPFDMEYVYATYLLELAEKRGTLVVNPPHALRAVNEKFFIANFPELTPKTVITSNRAEINSFIDAEQQCVIKPLDGMGGAGIFKLSADDPNRNIIIDTVSHFGTHTVMLQGFLPNVTAGDKRILLIDGDIAADYGLARLPQGKEFRANLAAGGRGVVQALTDKEREICEKIKPTLKELGLLFVGLDVIDGHITEINVTSPTCIREIDNETGSGIAERFIEMLEGKVKRVKS